LEIAEGSGRDLIWDWSGN